MRTVLTEVVCLVVALLAASLVVNACATNVLELKDEQLVRLSRIILTGQVTGIASEWNEDRTQIYTTVTISVTDVIKGQHSGDTYTLRFLGGQVDDTVMEVVGAPAFAAGEEVILFIDRNQEAVVPLVGMAQGKLTVRTDSASGARTVAERGEAPDVFLGRIRDIVAAQREVER